MQNIRKSPSPHCISSTLSVSLATLKILHAWVSGASEACSAQQLVVWLLVLNRLYSIQPNTPMHRQIKEKAHPGCSLMKRKHTCVHLILPAMRAQVHVVYARARSQSPHTHKQHTVTRVSTHLLSCLPHTSDLCSRTNSQSSLISSTHWLSAQTQTQQANHPPSLSGW